MTEKIHFWNEHGERVSLERRAFPSDDDLAQTVHENPELLPLDRIRADDGEGAPRTVVSLGRGICGSDVLCVDPEGWLYLVACRRQATPDRQLVLAQLIEQGSRLAALTFDELNSAVIDRNHGRDIRSLVEGIPDLHFDKFVAELYWSLKNGLFRYLVITEEAADELLRMADLMNRFESGGFAFGAYVVAAERFEGSGRIAVQLEVLNDPITRAASVPPSGRLTEARLLQNADAAGNGDLVRGLLELASRLGYEVVYRKSALLRLDGITLFGLSSDAFQCYLDHLRWRLPESLVAELEALFRQHPETSATERFPQARLSREHTGTLLERTRQLWSQQASAA